MKHEYKEKIENALIDHEQSYDFEPIFNELDRVYLESETFHNILDLLAKCSHQSIATEEWETDLHEVEYELGEILDRYELRKFEIENNR